MPVILVKSVGGIVLALYLISSAGLNLINTKIQHNTIVNEQIQQDIEEIADDIEYCEEIYIQNMIDNGELPEQISQSELEEIKDEFLEVYSRNYQDRIDIEQTTFDYMNKELPVDIQQYINRNHRTDTNDRILYNYIKRKLIKE